MTETRPRGPGGRRVRSLLLDAAGLPSVAGRIDRHTMALLGSPYAVAPLGGAPGSPEILSTRLDAFDCVTFVETVLALALSRTADDFPVRLRTIRYAGGRVSWEARNHYMTGWIRNNASAGLVRKLALGRGVRKERTLDLVPGLPPRRARFVCLPKRHLAALGPMLRTGDLLFFVSTKAHLDVFHCGVVVRRGEALRMRHASRGQGGAVEEELSGFLRRHRMAGVIVVRPAAAPAEGRA